jgi:hypothetical protein
MGNRDRWLVIKAARVTSRVSHVGKAEHVNWHSIQHATGTVLDKLKDSDSFRSSISGVLCAITLYASKFVVMVSLSFSIAKEFENTLDVSSFQISRQHKIN